VFKVGTVWDTGFVAACPALLALEHLAMSSDDASIDPYRSPVLPETPYSAGSGKRKPGWLTAICVICLVLGLLGFFNGVIGLGFTVFNKQVQQVFNPPGARQGMPPELQKFQQKLQDEMQAIYGQFFVPTLISTLLKAIISVVLFVGGLLTLTLKSSGRKLLVLACILALLFELGISALQGVIYMETLTVLNQLIDGFVQELKRVNGPLSQAATTSMQVILYASMVLFFIIQFVKIGFFYWSANYLRRPAIVELCNSR
jgi:hypothetical protein